VHAVGRLTESSSGTPQTVISVEVFVSAPASTPAAAASAFPSPVVTPELAARIEALFPRYPTRQAVTLPALHIVQEHYRCVPAEAIPEIARLLGLAPAQVYDTLSFYGFFKDRPCGKLRAWVCRSISCALRGGEEVLERLADELGIPVGGTTADGEITLEFGECLGLCDFAPAMLAGETVYKDLSPESAPETARALRRQAAGG
jgi:NADH-quinone oxidoreductase subunit E